MGVFVPIWLVLPRREATNLGVFVLCHFALISPYSKGAVQIRVGLELADLSRDHVVILGNGRNTVSRVLFRRRELTEFYGKLGEFCEKLGEFALAHK